MYYTDGGGSTAPIKSTGVKFNGFNNDASLTKKEEDKFDKYPGGLFTVPNNTVAYNNSVGGDEGGFNA